MNDIVQLVGLDFGTTTSSAVVAHSELRRNAVTGRVELGYVEETYRSEMVFTPFAGERLDEAALERLIDDWFEAGAVRPAELFGGGALLTGLTAQRSNAPGLVALVRRRLGNALVATADDPCLESWLAFMGSCARLSRAHPDVPILNFDIGGGTTNLALGRGGDVRRTGCYFIGARHFQVDPGTYRLRSVSKYARALLDHLGIRCDVGAELPPAVVATFVDWYAAQLEALASDRADSEQAIVALHRQIGFSLPPDVGEVAITFSGGVGELIYRHVHGEPWPATTRYGDVGIDLAQRIVASPILSRSLQMLQPAAAGRATVYGLLRHNVDISGATVFLPDPHPLPLHDLPLFGNLSETTSDSEVLERLALASARGGAYRVECNPTATAVKMFGTRLARSLRDARVPADRPMVLFVRSNIGKVLGEYITGWGTEPRSLIVIDEIDCRDAQYVQVGAPRGSVLPVSFFGFNE
jgi:ethanolamine utilization protein EutA